MSEESYLSLIFCRLNLLNHKVHGAGTPMMKDR